MSSSSWTLKRLVVRCHRIFKWLLVGSPSPSEYMPQPPQWPSVLVFQLHYMSENVCNFEGKLRILRPWQGLVKVDRPGSKRRKLYEWKQLLKTHRVFFFFPRSPSSYTIFPPIWYDMSHNAVRQQAVSSSRLRMDLSYPWQHFWGAGADSSPLFPLLMGRPVPRVSTAPAVHTRSEFRKTNRLYSVQSVSLCPMT